MKYLSKSASLEIVAQSFYKIPNEISGGVHLLKTCRSQVFKLTKDRLHLPVPLRILKIFRKVVSWTPVASYFHYYVMLWSLLVKGVFNLDLFRWQHWQMTSDCLFNKTLSGSPTISHFLCKNKLDLLELRTQNIYLLFALQDIHGWRFLFAIFQYSVYNFLLFFPH